MKINTSSATGVSFNEKVNIVNKSNNIKGADDLFEKVESQEVISSIHNDWKNKIRNIDLDIKKLQNDISKLQVKQNLIVDIQTELIDYPANKEVIEKNINNLIEKYSYNNENVLEKVKFNDENDIYKYSADIEIEKNKTYEQIAALSVEVKAKLISKQNILLVNNDIEIDTSQKAINEMTKYILELGDSFKVNNSHLKSLFSS